MKISTETLVRSALAILLLLCLFNMPYGYYQLLRFVAVVGFAILAYYEFERKNVPMAFVFAGLAFLFQPLLKVSLGREVWQIVDVLTAAGLLVTVFLQNKKSG